jgi:2-iminoacetate synthase
VAEIKALLKHVAEMESRFGVGPHTISVPRIKPARGAELSFSPPYPIDDDFFTYIIAVLRLAVPYTGIILSTREKPELRDRLFGVGVSQISAGSSTTPGGYKVAKDKTLSQFTTSDERSLAEIVKTLTKNGYIASFCTACYRKGRVGEDFMSLAKTGNIKTFCNSNALLSLAEYAVNFLTDNDRKVVLNLIEEELASLPNKKALSPLITKIYNGEKDVYL